MPDKARILIIDDEEDYLELMSFWFESKGYDIRTASRGKDGIEKIKSDPPDMVFLDSFMPELDGVGTLKAIREFNKTIPVIVFTAAAIKNVKDAYPLNEFKELGVAGFFDKKDSFEELTGKFEDILKIHKAEEGGDTGEDG